MIRQVIDGVRFLVTGCHSSRAQVHPREEGGNTDAPVQPVADRVFNGNLEQVFPRVDIEEEAAEKSLDEGVKDQLEQEGASSPEMSEMSSGSRYFRAREAFVLDEEGTLIEPGRDEIFEGLRAADFVLPDGSDVFYAPNVSGPGVPRVGVGRQDAEFDVFADSSDEESCQESTVEQGGYRGRLQTGDDVNVDLSESEGNVNGMVPRAAFRVHAQLDVRFGDEGEMNQALGAVEQDGDRDQIDVNENEVGVRQFRTDFGRLLTNYGLGDEDDLEDEGDWSFFGSDGGSTVLCGSRGSGSGNSVCTEDLDSMPLTGEALD